MELRDKALVNGFEFLLLETGPDKAFHPCTMVIEEAYMLPSCSHLT
jgi:hypothetical protein